ncbi:toll/interleukin-1 receptor domain-containing protein [Archangium sp.]|uniref:toll/interleukin-1 receptor domain-containing protein n=1 Tax=Archangium sp. TaxID=1872627 RepID=UPI00286D5EBD|nr:toll/interleukin-1 receptor domain-containing protein [Archangium sp.]
MDTRLEEELTRFKRYRDAMIHADAQELEHHLKEFVREVRRNSLTAAILAELPTFDHSAWWQQETESAQQGDRLSSLRYPDDDNERLVVLLDLAESMASDDPEQISVSGFGQLFGKYKMVDAAAAAINLALRPFAELLSDKLRRRVEVANPAVRELAGVPLDRIPADDEIRIFLSHKSVNKPLVEPYYEFLQQLGLSPWLDSKDMKAGDILYREITSGFERSCAVVFFVTKDFRDDPWLKHEVEQAMARAVVRGARFAIITLVFDGAEIPLPLQNHLCIKVENPVQAMRQILRALPIVLGPPLWRA